VTPEEQLDEVMPLLRIMARQHAKFQPWMIEDCIQEASIRAWQRFEQGHPKGIAIYAARQAIFSLLSGRRPTGSADGMAGKTDTARQTLSTDKGGEVDSEDGGFDFAIALVDESAAAAFAAVETAQALEPILATLSDPQRVALAAYIFEGLTMAEIAEREGVSHQAISARLGKAAELVRPLVRGVF
jgi:RNA polymerase sigma factor (sigma-70 family)